LGNYNVQQTADTSATMWRKCCWLLRKRTAVYRL